MVKNYAAGLLVLPFGPMQDSITFGCNPANHVHLLISQSKNIALSALMKDVKKDSSSWIKTKGTKFRQFHWQDGYEAFSIGKADLSGLLSIRGRCPRLLNSCASRTRSPYFSSSFLPAFKLSKFRIALKTRK